MLAFRDLAQGYLDKGDVLHLLRDQHPGIIIIRDQTKGDGLPPFPDQQPLPTLDLYARPRQSEFSHHTFPRARNVFQDVVSTLPPLVNTSPAPPAPARVRSPSTDVLLEVYSYTRHPLDLRKHLTVLPTWASKAETELTGECFICYEKNKHLQIGCKQCQTMKVCCCCVVGVYQSIKNCPVCRFRGEY